jgi:hypothetical protein
MSIWSDCKFEIQQHAFAKSEPSNTPQPKFSLLPITIYYPPDLKLEITSAAETA